MGKINFANVKKTIYYFRRNGWKNTCLAVRERLEGRRIAPYRFTPPTKEELARQSSWAVDRKRRFSIVVPLYKTPEPYLREMICSVAAQSYPHWELILADATEGEGLESAVESIAASLDFSGVSGDGENAEHRDVWARQNSCICYIKLSENGGISRNTNEALKHAAGEYVALLDHDDLLTADALYQMAFSIEKAAEQGCVLQMLYSDEDKCNEDASHYYEYHGKEDFNPDLLFSNNYICHFLVMRRELIQELELRPECDGAQDYDLVLRAVGKLWNCGAARQEQIAHIPQVLYHWRCHGGSTAENPASKQYAYEAGLRALQDFADNRGWNARAVHLKHLGFYRLEYEKGVLECRHDLGAVGGKVLGYMEDAAEMQQREAETDGPTVAIGRQPASETVKASDRRRCLIGGRMSREGEVYYHGLPESYSGYMNRAVLTQSAEAVDLRCICLSRECRDLFETVVGVPYREVECKGNAPENRKDLQMIFDVSSLPQGADIKTLSLKLSDALREAGYAILYDPALEIRWKGGERYE